MKKTHKIPALNSVGLDRYGFRPFIPNPWPTEAEIMAQQTEAGGWTRQTLADWGVPWPPPQGWKSALLNHDERWFRRLLGGLNPTSRGLFPLGQSEPSKPRQADPYEAERLANLRHFKSI
jgi:hypothetical protein